MPQFKAQCVFPLTDGKLPVAVNKAVVSDGHALCSPTFGWVRQCGGLQIVSKSGPKIILYCPYEKFLVLRNKVMSLLLTTRWGSTIFSWREKNENLNFSSNSLSATHCSFGYWTLSTSHCNSIALPFAYSTFYTHPPLPEVWLTPELWEPLETCSFLVPHSLTLPE